MGGLFIVTVKDQCVDGYFIFKISSSFMIFFYHNQFLFHIMKCIVYYIIIRKECEIKRSFVKIAK